LVQNLFGGRFMNGKFQWLVIAIGGLALAGQAHANPPVYGNSSNSNHPAPARPAPRAFTGVSNAGYRGMAPAYRQPAMQRYGGAPVYSGQRFSSMTPLSRSPQFQNFGSARAYSDRQRFSSMATTDRDMAWRQMFPRNVQPRSNTLTINGSRAPADSTVRNVAPATTRTGTGSFQNTRSGSFSQPTGVNRARSSTTQNHVFARRSATWQPNWDRSCDHFWRGHLCRFVNNSWVVFDFGFIPWWSVGYPFDYGYGYDYYPYPYAYDPGYYGYGGDGDYYYGQGDGYGQNDAYGQNGYQAPSDQYVQDDSPVAAAQERLARMGYYHGKIDGAFGPETQRAVQAFQRDHALNPTGYLTMDTRRALGLDGG
jgi:Putative peptidoglycan binding domain